MGNNYMATPYGSIEIVGLLAEGCGAIRATHHSGHKTTEEATFYSPCHLSRRNARSVESVFWQASGLVVSCAAAREPRPRDVGPPTSSWGPNVSAGAPERLRRRLVD